MCLKGHLEIRGQDLFVLQTLTALDPALGAEQGRESVRMKAITQCFPGALRQFICINLSLLFDP